MKTRFYIAITFLILGIGYKFYQVYYLKKATISLKAKVNKITHDLSIEKTKLINLLKAGRKIPYSKLNPEILDINESNINDYLYANHLEGLFIDKQPSIINKNSYRINSLLSYTSQKLYYDTGCWGWGLYQQITNTTQDSLYFYIPPQHNNHYYSVTIDNTTYPFKNKYPKIIAIKQKDTVRISSTIITMNFLTDLSIDTVISEDIFVRKGSNYELLRE